MTVAVLKFDGIAPLKGTAEAGGDYITFRTDAQLSNQQLNELHRALIEIGRESEAVLVESTDIERITADPFDEHERLHLTLRRHTPPAV